MPQASSLYTTISIDNLGQEIAFRYYTYIYEERSASSATYIVDRYPLIEECCGEGRETGPSRCSHTNTHTHTHIYIYISLDRARTSHERRSAASRRAQVYRGAAISGPHYYAPAAAAVVVD